MRKFAKAMLAGGAVAGLVAASGFPRRMGLTKAQSLVSMPGDLVLPAAQTQVDRAITVNVQPESVWPYVIQLRHDYRDLWDTPLEVEVIDEPHLVVWKTGRPAEDPSAELFNATAAILLEPSVDGSTRIHVRERYQYLSGKGRVAVGVVTAASAVTIWGRLRKIRRAAADMQAGRPTPAYR